jgi:ectoine hydroxylase-related dioxygenase (phytanoyl-CoA dioxygenase family)
MFDARSCVYTSLTFRHGTQQPVHRDTPHFATWPESHFAGVWTALEDVHESAGPLFYYKGAHRMQIEHPHEYMRRANRRLPDASQQERLFMALDLYNGAVIKKSQEFGPPVTLPLAQGDVVIWHPEMPHGGSPAADPMKTRWSIVCHCAPEQVQVHQHETFFQHAGPEAPSDRYVYLEEYERKIALAGAVAFMQ